MKAQAMSRGRYGPTLSLASAVDGGEGVVNTTHLPLYSQETSPDTHCTGGWVSPRMVWTIWRKYNLLLPPGFKPWTIQPVSNMANKISVFSAYFS